MATQSIVPHLLIIGIAYTAWICSSDTLPYSQSIKLPASINMIDSILGALSDPVQTGYSQH